MQTRRRQFLIAAVLLAATTALGAAARSAGHAPLPDAAPIPPTTTTFVAPSAGAVSFTGTLDRRAVLRTGDGLARMELVIAAPAVAHETAQRRPTDLIVVLDRSGSMQGDKIEYARAAVRELLAQLAPQDRFALVTYSDDAATDIALAPVGDARGAQWSAHIASIAASGGTNMSSGLDRGLALVDTCRQPGRVPHVILISDGLANQGDATPEGLTGRARRAAQGEYVLSTIGVGSDFNESLMTTLADAGTGNYYYVADPRELGGVFAREFDAARTTVASGLTVRIEPESGVRVVDAAGYPLEADGTAVLFRPGALFDGQERRVWLTLSVPHAALGEQAIGRFSLAYDEGGQRRTLAFAETPRIACVEGQDEFYSGIDASAWGRGMVVDAYNRMQQDVARAVKEGRRDAALERVRAFKAEAAPMNARVQSPPVAAQIESADRLAGEVSSAFEGVGQAARQNALSKQAGATALDARRAGAKK